MMVSLAGRSEVPVDPVIADRVCSFRLLPLNHRSQLPIELSTDGHASVTIPSR